MNLQLFFLMALSAVLFASGFAQPQKTPPSSAPVKLHPLPRSLEVHLALAAAPPYLRSGATVFVLDPDKGYVLERKGTNGFTCYVQRTDYVREDFEDNYIAPECQGPEGTKSIVPVEFDIERIRAEGKMNPVQLKREITRRFEAGTYHPPAHPGIAYMLSPIVRLYAGPGSRETMALNIPHYMFFVPNQDGKDLGAGPVMGPYPYFINPGPMAYLILHVGETEKRRINQDSQELLNEACEYRPDLCLIRTTTAR